MHATKIAYSTLHRLAHNKQPAKYENAKLISALTGGAVSITELQELPADVRAARAAAKKRVTVAKKSSPRVRKTRIKKARINKTSINKTSNGKSTSYVPPKLAAARA